MKANGIVEVASRCLDLALGGGERSGPRPCRSRLKAPGSYWGGDSARILAGLDYVNKRKMFLLWRECRTVAAVEPCTRYLRPTQHSLSGQTRSRPHGRYSPLGNSPKCGMLPVVDGPGEYAYSLECGNCCDPIDFGKSQLWHRDPTNISHLLSFSHFTSAELIANWVTG